MRLRLVPLAIAASLGLLGLKLGHIWLALDPLPVAPAYAQKAEKPAAPGPEKTPADKPAPEKPPAEKMPAPPPADKVLRDPLSMSPAEVELLQKLADRRAELDKRAAELSQREVLLEAAERRIDEKIAKLAALEKDIGGAVEKQSEEDEARLKSLVRIYETMKPQDAARIFEQLDMPVLLGVIEHMKELKVAPILAALDPAKARAVTLAVAERRGQQDKPAATPPKSTQQPAAKP